jgi:hypothetical protein
MPLGVATALTVCTIVIHAIALAASVRFVRREGERGRTGKRFWTDVVIVAGVTVLALAAHLLDIAVWALVFASSGEFPRFASAFYHSAGSYTTLGYGDVTMSAGWRLLEPLEAADAMLMFGISTGMIFAIIQSFVQTRFPRT